MACQEIIERLFVIIGNGDIGFPEHDSVPLDDRDFGRLHNKRTMHAHKTALGEHLLYAFHAYERHYGLRLSLQVNFDIIFQPFDIKDLVQVNLLQFIIALHKYMVYLSRAGR